MVWSGRKQPDRIRPSEINGCTVQQVSYLHEIDDENVLEALEKLRGKSSVNVGAFLAATSTKTAPQKPPRSPPRSPSKSSNTVKPNSSANSSSVTTVQKVNPHSISTVKGSHRSFESSKRVQAPQVAPVSPDSSVASSVVSSRRGIKKTAPPPKKLLTWTWLSDFNCGGDSGDATEKLHKLGVIFRNEDGEPRQKRLSALNKALSQHLVKRCTGGGDDEDAQTLGSAILLTQRDESSLFDWDTVTQKSLQEAPFDEEADKDEDDVEQEDNAGGLKSEISRFLSATADMLAGGNFGDSDTVTLYTYSNMERFDSRFGDDKSFDETFYTLGSFDETLTLTVDEAPDDEIHQDMRRNKKSLMDDSKEVAKMGEVTFTSGDSEQGIFSRNVAVASLSCDEGLEVNQHGVPQQLVVVGCDPPEDCSLLSDSSPVFMQAVSKKGKVIKPRRR